MTTPKCPLCGNDIQVVYNNYYKGWASGCFECGWRTALMSNTKKDALEAAEEFISKFPPIMRLKQGDNVMLYDRELCAVHSVNLKYNRVVLQNCRADIMVETADKIKKWPWEFEQEGGQQ